MRDPVHALLLFMVVVLAGCAHAPGYPPQAIGRPENVTDFATLYNENCAACHGANGQSGPAMDLANPEYQALVDDASLRKWISGGMPGTEMPAFAQSAGGMLTDAQIGAIIAGMRKAWSQPNAFAGATPPPYAQYAAGDFAQGRQVYGARCASCHRSAQQDVTSPNYLSLVSDQALRSIVIAGRPDIGQPDWRLGPASSPDGRPVVSTQDVDDVVAYLASLRTPAQAANAATTQPKAAQPASAKGPGGEKK
jgi:mono/diheme cytochrome c family protein